MHEHICAFVKSSLGETASDVRVLKASGSQRQYYRVTLSGKTVIVCYSDNIRENRTFISLSEYLYSQGLPVVRILGISYDCSMYVLEDLGEMDMMMRLLERRERDAYDSVWQDIELSIDELVKFQRLPEEGWKDKVDFPPFGSDLIRSDFKYAVDNFFKPMNLKFNIELLDSDFLRLEERLMAYPEKLWGLMYRDFQSRNIMLNPTPYMIDFQSARKGPGIYDVVSFAWQAKAKFNPSEREKIINHYINRLALHGVEAKEEVMCNVKYWALFRILQTFGAYGLRGLKEGKQHFIESLPLAVKNFVELVNDYRLDKEFNELTSIIYKL